MSRAKLCIAKIRGWARRAPGSRRRGEILACVTLAIVVSVLAILVTVKFSPVVRAQISQSELPTPQNLVVAKIIDPVGRLTNLQPLIIIANNQLHVSVPEPKFSFRPGKYKLELWIWQGGNIYYTENDFSWGVLAVNFNKSIYNLGDKSKIGLAVLDDQGHTICNADMDMNIVSPSGKTSYFSTQDKTISHNLSCGPGSVTNDPDYSATILAGEVGTYNVSVTARTANGTRQISDKFEVQNPPMFDVERNAPTRIFPPATYKVSIAVKANDNFHGNITETVPGTFDVTASSAETTLVKSSGSPTLDTKIISWPVNLKKGDSVSLTYSFKAPDVSPELYKLGPLQIGNWSEARQWQVAADSVANTVIFITSLASTTWQVPNDWNNTSNTIELIAGGGGGATNSGTGGSSNRGGAAGGGGAYAMITNFSTSTGNLVKIGVGTGGAAQATGTLTYFNWSGGGTTSTCSGTTMQLCAMGGGRAVTGNPGSFGTGGASSTSVGTVKYGGGPGGADALSKTAGAGGGGAGGPSGDGQGGTNTTIGTGGAGDAGVAAGGTGGLTGTNPGGTGGPGSEWTSNPGGVSGGSGGGGGGSTGNSSTGGTGGNYGGGGGGGRSSGGAGGVGQQGIIVITYTPSTITMADGTQPANVTVGPGANATTSAVFTLVTNNNTVTSSITSIDVNIATTTGVFQVQIADNAGTTIYGSSTNPGSTSLTINTTNMVVSTTTLTFRTMIKPLDATSMPTTPVSGAGAVGGTYVVTSTLPGTFTDNKSWDHAGANTTSSIITIDNLSPADVTNASGTVASSSVAFTWNNPGDTDFATTTIVRATSSISIIPTEGTYYTVGQTLNATTTVVCVVASSSASNCTDSGLTAGTTYYYMIFTADNYLNYSSGTVPTNNPFTPSNNQPPTVSAVSLNHGNAITLTPNATTSFDLNWSVSDPDGCANINTNTATSTAFRLGVKSTCAVPGPTTSSLSCYLYLTRTTSTCSGTTINTTDTVGIYYFADSTGNNSSTYPSDHWEAFALASDAAGATSSATSTNVDINVLSAVNVTTSSIDYSTVTASSTSAEQIATTTNAGNSTTSIQLYALSTLSCSSGGCNGTSITTSSQHYASSTGASFDSTVALTDSPVTLTGIKLKTPTSTVNVSQGTFWFLNVPAGTATGTFSGTNVFSPAWSP